MKKAGLYFGTYNPIHTGHLIIAATVQEEAGLDEVWFVVSPQNPFKKNDTPVHARDRLEMVHLAIEGNDPFRACDIEFNLPKPSFTIDTLTYISEQYKQHSFALIIGEDNLLHFHKWKNYEKILQYYKVLVYPRPPKNGDAGENTVNEALQRHPSVCRITKPLMEISSSGIRERLKAGKSIRYFVPDAVIKYIEKYGLYA